MTAITPPPPDSGTQPAPHYCTSSRRPDGITQGCPSWPGCLFPGRADDDAIAAAKADDWRTLGQNLAALAGWTAGAVLLLIVAAILLPVFL